MTIEEALATRVGEVKEGIGFFRGLKAEEAVKFLVESGKYRIKSKNVFGTILEEIK